MSNLNGKGRTVQLADGPFVIHYTADRLISLEKECASYGALLDMAREKVVTATALMLWAAGATDLPESAAARIPIGSIAQVRDALTDELIVALGAGGAAPAEASGVDPTTPKAPIPGANSSATPAS